MNTLLKARIESAINKTILDNCENDMWEHYIHSDLSKEMANAAEAVFDAAQNAQKFYIQETE